MFKRKNRFFNFLGKLGFFGYKLCMATVGVTVTKFSVLTLNIPGVLSGACMIASAVSSMFKSRSIKPGASLIHNIIAASMKGVDFVAQNDGKAKNDPTVNE